MLRNVMTGIAAGAVGTTVLNAVTYADMALRGRPASRTPADTVLRMERLAGAATAGNGGSAGDGDDGGGDRAGNRREALGALLGIASGLGVGALYGLVAPHLGRTPVVVRGIGAGLVANVGTTGPMVALGVTDPRTWEPGSWLADLVPHLSYGLATAAAWEAARAGRRSAR